MRYLKAAKDNPKTTVAGILSIGAGVAAIRAGNYELAVSAICGGVIGILSIEATDKKE